MRNTLTKSSDSDVPSSPEALKDFNEGSSPLNVSSPSKSSTTLDTANAETRSTDDVNTGDVKSATNETNPAIR